METRYLRHSSVEALDVTKLNAYADEGYILCGFTYNCDQHCYEYIFAKPYILQINHDTENTNNDGGHLIMLDNNNNVENPPKRFMFKNALIGLGVKPQTAADWIKVRQAKKAAQTETAFRLIEKQIKLAMDAYGVDADDIIRVAIDRNWQSVKCEWLDNVDWSNYGIQVGKNDLPFNDQKWE